MARKRTSDLLKKAIRRTGRHVIALNLLATILIGIFTVTLYYRANELQTRIVELQIQNQRLQNMIFNYTPTLFVSPQDDLVIDLNKYSQPNGILKLLVVVVTPHNGYAFVNETSFTLSPDPDMTLPYLDPNALTDNRVDMYHELIFAVPAGSYQTTLEVSFWCDVWLSWEWKQLGHGADFPLGVVSMSVTFFDAQSNAMYTKPVTAIVRVSFQNPTQSV